MRQKSNSLLALLYLLSLVAASSWVVLLTVALLRFRDGRGEVLFSELVQGMPGAWLLESAVGLSLVGSWLGSLYVWTVRRSQGKAVVPALVLLLAAGLFAGAPYVLCYGGSSLGLRLSARSGSQDSSPPGSVS